jgi:hypothetical protein
MNCDVTAWTGFSWLGVVSGGGAYDPGNEPSGCIIRLPAWQLSASAGGLLAMYVDTAVWMAYSDLQLLIATKSLPTFLHLQHKSLYTLSRITTVPICTIAR